MNIPLSCPNCGHEDNVDGKNAKEITPVIYKKFNVHFIEKDSKRFKNLSDPTENIMGDIRVTF